MVRGLHAAAVPEVRGGPPRGARKEQGQARHLQLPAGPRPSYQGPALADPPLPIGTPCLTQFKEELVRVLQAQYQLIEQSIQAYF